jgi:hypothetical protein
MNIFANFVQSLKQPFQSSASVLASSSNCETLILIPNSLSAKPSLNRKRQIKEKQMFDYSTILMRIEQNTKKLSNKCLNNDYEGFVQPLMAIHSDLTLLGMWAVNKEAQQIVNDITKQE